MSKVSCSFVRQVAIVTRRAWVVSDAEVIRMEEHGVAVCNVELFFVAQQLLPLLGERCDESLSNGG